jgi:hypothetical protein
MNLNWKENKSAESIIHYTEFAGVPDDQVQLAINSSIDKMAQLLDSNINDDSMYLMFEWDIASSLLSIVVTDETKSHDSANVVQCCFTKIDETLNSEDELAEDVEFWVRDYLTTCTVFLNYSLIAAFHCGSRAASKLL